ncbi:MAG TPA: penicillin acylase family protein [Streptosporangiaceae bacterium]
MKRWKAWQRWLAAVAAGGAVAAGVPAGVGLAAAGTASGMSRYEATIIRTAYGVPHITARNFGSLGYGTGYAFASDNLCTMANGYLTVEGERSRYFGPNAGSGNGPNLQSDFFWKSVIQGRVIPRLLSVRTGPGAIGPQLRQLLRGYAAGYNGYLASVGGTKGVPNPVCRGKAWVKPITTLDVYLRMYQISEMEGQDADPAAISTAQPPSASTTATGPLSAAWAARELGRAQTARENPARNIGSNAVAIGSAGTRGQDKPGILLGNPHFPWTGPDRFYEMQLTIPGVLNVEGVALYGVPLVLIGFTSRMAWSHTVSAALPIAGYQLTLVPKHPTEYVYNGKPLAMTSRTVTVQVRQKDGTLKPASDTIRYSRYGPMINNLEGLASLPWTTTTAFTLADTNAANLRFINHFLATDEAQSTAQELSVLHKYEGLPWVNTLVADSGGHALYADIQTVPDVTNAEAARCDTAVGKVTFAKAGFPVLDGAKPSCALATGPGAAAPGLFGPGQEPELMRHDFVENSNDSQWMANPAHPLTGFPRIIGRSGTEALGAEGTDLGLRTRSALTMAMKRISGTDGLGPPGFTFQNIKNLFYSDIQFGASLVKPELVAMCRAFPGGKAPTRTGTIPVGSSCNVLAAWNGRENPGSRGAALFREFWQRALNVPGGPWTHQFDRAHPVTTPNGLNTASTAVQKAFGNALAAMTTAHLPYNVPLGTIQYELKDGVKIPMPGGPGDPLGEFNAIYLGRPGDVTGGSSYVQAVTWKHGDACPEVATILTYSESDNPNSPHYADQTRLFSRKGWVTTYFCPAQVLAHAVSAIVVHGS